MAEPAQSDESIDAVTESSSRPDRPEHSPAPVRTVVVLITILAVGLLLVALDNIAADSTGPSGENLGIGPLVLAALLGWVARGLGQRRRGSRIAVYVVFGFLALGGVGIVKSDPTGPGLFGLLPIALGVLMIGLLAAPQSSREWFAPPEIGRSPGERAVDSTPEADGGERPQAREWSQERMRPRWARGRGRR